MANISLTEENRQLLMRVLTDCVVLTQLTKQERERYALIVQAVGLACEPAPLGLIENVGSCEPGPHIQWDKTQSTWHTDVDKVGRYSVRRLAKRQPYGAYLNNKSIPVPTNPDASVVKRGVELRIIEARRINALADKKQEPWPLTKGAGTMGRYHVQVFDLNARRDTDHHCDGTYDLIFDALQAVTVGIAESNTGSILIRDQFRIDNHRPSNHEARAYK